MESFFAVLSYLSFVLLPIVDCLLQKTERTDIEGSKATKDIPHKTMQRQAQKTEDFCFTVPSKFSSFPLKCFVKTKKGCCAPCGAKKKKKKNRSRRKRQIRPLWAILFPLINASSFPH